MRLSRVSRALPLAVVAWALSWLAIPARAEVLAASYLADIPFPQYMPLWQEGWSFSDEEGNPLVLAKSGMPLGGYVFLHFRNTTDKPITVADLEVEGVRLAEGLAKTVDTSGPLDGHSVLVSKLPKAQLSKLLDAGQPLWWKAEPRQVPAGGLAQIVMRLRRDPKPGKLGVAIITDGQPISATVPTRKPQPRFATIAFAPELDKVYLYVRHPKPGMRPGRVLLDEQDMTAQCTIATDSSLNLVPIILTLPRPLEMMSYHCFHAVYADGSVAAAGICTWGWDFVYGMWGGKDDPKQTLTDFARHNINVQMGMASKSINEMSLEPGGKEYLDSLGIRQMATWFGNARKPLFYFLQDEPDAQDPGVDDVPPADRLGCVAQYLVEKMETLRAKDPNTPILLNIDNTYKPENWYVYHQLADIPCHDPYYSGELDLCYTKYPGRFSAHTRPTYVLASVSISQSACQPKPLHTILCSTSSGSPDAKPGEYVGRFPTPEEIRLQAYYAIAAGSKGLSYWWYTPSRDWGGCGGDSPGAKALWREIGIVGAEMRTAGPLLTTSCPVELPVTPSRYLMVRTLLHGPDTVVAVALNNNVLSDRVGTVYKPLANAQASLTIPSWLNPTDVFEVSQDGTKDVRWKRDGAKVSLELGTVNLSRLIVITSDAGLRSALQRLYETKFAQNVAALTATQGQ